ncbi:MAG: hypothetical protein JW837_08675 [Sedimentisphaerales bacterium]|nr:hypothetical protein [Sedimentisphaerales bacterium]
MQIPARGITLNKTHPLSRGLFGLWPADEGTGTRMADTSGNGRHGNFSTGAPVWAAGRKLGSAVSFDGDDIVTVGSLPLLSANCSLLVWSSCNTDSPNYECPLNCRSTGSNGDLFGVFYRPSGAIHWWCGGSGGNNSPGGVWSVGQLQCFVVTHDADGQGRLYIDGKLIQTAGGKTWSTGIALAIWWGKYVGAGLTPLNGLVEMSAVWDNKTLSACEVAQLYKEPFCMLNRTGQAYLISSQIINPAGTTAGQSSLTASLKVTKKLAGNITGSSTVNGELVIENEPLPETKATQPPDALFNGMTANAYKLGTVLTLGRFWTRTNGCSVLYRGNSLEETDFANILAVTEPDECETAPPAYLSHSGNKTYFYIVRRFNGCGYQEHTLAAVVKISMDSYGEPAEPKPNKLFDSVCGFVDGDKIQLVWHYCPIRQESAPARFNVYYDNRSGEVDYQNPIAQIDYKGQKFYSFRSDTLEAGGYLFAVRAEDADGTENISASQLKIQLNPKVLSAIDILRAESV